MKKPLIVAHRGAMKTTPENTLAAFEQAIQLGADAIELDVYLSRDGVIFVHHDLYFGRTSTGSGFVGDKTAADIRSLDAGSWFGTRFAGESIPLLCEVLALGKSRARFEIELKEPSIALLEAVVREVTALGLMADVELTSGHWPLLCKARTLFPELRLGTWFSVLPDWMQAEHGQQQILANAELLALNVVHLPARLIQPEFIATLKTRGFVAYGANLDTEDEMRMGMAAGIDQFSTTDVEVAVRLRDQEIGSWNRDRSRGSLPPWPAVVTPRPTRPVQK
jgi:glycerophosphoryl diester phosphodiesterase